MLHATFFYMPFFHWYLIQRGHHFDTNAFSITFVKVLELVLDGALQDRLGLHVWFFEQSLHAASRFPRHKRGFSHMHAFSHAGMRAGTHVGRQAGR